MTRDDLTAQMRAIVAARFKAEPTKVTPDTRFMDDLGGDSVDVVELLMEFQEAFGLTIPDEDAEDLIRFGAAVDYLSAKLGVRASGRLPT